MGTYQGKQVVPRTSMVARFDCEFPDFTSENKVPETTHTAVKIRVINIIIPIPSCMIMLFVASHFGRKQSVRPIEIRR